MTVLILLTGLAPALVMWSVAPAQRRRARSWWILGLLVAGAAALLPLEPWLSVVILGMLVWWFRVPDDLVGDRAGEELYPVVLAWGAVAGTWFAARAIPEAEAQWILWLWGAVATGHVGLMVHERLWGKDRRAPHGGFAQRFYAGSCLAMLCAALPLGFWPIVLVGLFLSGPSWAGVLALAAGSAVRWPWTMPYLASAVLVAAGMLFVPVRGDSLLNRLPRGDSLDGMRVRITVWRLAVAHWLRSPVTAKLIGLGPGSGPRSSRRWNLRHPRMEALGNLHSEPVQVVYEYGLLGLLGLGLFIGRVGAGFQWGDPWTAGVVAGMVVACVGNSSGIIPLGVTFLILCARVAP